MGRGGTRYLLWVIAPVEAATGQKCTRVSERPSGRDADKRIEGRYADDSSWITHVPCCDESTQCGSQLELQGA